MGAGDVVIPTPDGTTFRMKEAFKYDSAKCPHTSVEIDPILSNLTCEQCGSEINPIAWLDRLRNDRARWDYQREELEKARRRYESKKTTRCEHCNKVTRVTEPRDGLHQFQVKADAIEPSTAPRLLDETPAASAEKE